MGELKTSICMTETQGQMFKFYTEKQQIILKTENNEVTKNKNKEV